MGKRREKVKKEGISSGDLITEKKMQRICVREEIIRERIQENFWKYKT